MHGFIFAFQMFQRDDAVFAGVGGDIEQPQF